MQHITCTQLKYIFSSSKLFIYISKFWVVGNERADE